MARSLGRPRPISLCRRIASPARTTHGRRTSSLFGLRNRAEENNLWFKSDAATDIGNPEKRRARGYAYNFLSAGMAAAVSNMRRIASRLEAETSVVDRPTLRARRRVDIDGKPLQRDDAIAA